MSTLIDLNAPRLRIDADPENDLLVVVTVPNSYETGVWTAPVFTDNSLQTQLGSFSTNVVGQDVQVTATAAAIDALVSGSWRFTAWWELRRTSTGATRTWVKGEFMVDAGRFAS